MSITEPIPDIKNLFEDKDKLLELFKLGQNSEFHKTVTRANDEYFYWTELKNRTPPGLKPEDLWVYVKLMRSVNYIQAVFTDKNGTPFQYWIPPCLYRVISEVDRWTGGTLISTFPELPSKQRYIISSLMDEAIASSQLEGASTEHRVAKEMLRTGRKPNDKNEQMIFNNWKAMQYIRQNASKALSLEMLLEIQTILTENTLEHPEDTGRFRDVATEVDVIYRNEVVHQAVNGRLIIPNMKLLCEFANNNKPEEWIHPVVKGAMLHFWIGYVHPFGDGNGRTARSVMYWYLLNQGRELFQYLSISKHFLRSPGQYVRAYVHTERDQNDLTYFLLYNLNAVRYGLEDLRKYLHEKQEEIARANSLLRATRGLNLRQKSVILHTLKHPHTTYTIDAHKNSHGISYQTARNDLLSLSKKGFFKIEKEGPKRLLFLPIERMLEKLHSHQQSLQSPQ
jgi:Fic family protein